ncbi:MAG: hypothetical protein L3J38_00395 [Thiomicrorhabdus sp.]|nr:hypothetical protein [Thiomicrorhabdus sp.]
MILFSALSSAWAGMFVFPESQNDSVHLQVFSEQEKSLSAQDKNHLAYDCTSMQSEENVVQKMDHEYCVNCFDQCQCDNSTCHKVNSPLVGIDLDYFNSQNVANRLTVIASSPLNSAPVFLDFRPPKNS